MYLKKTHHISTNTCRMSIFSTYWYLVPQSSRVTQVQARSQFEHLAGIRLVWGTLVVTPSTLKEKKLLSQFTTDNRRQLHVHVFHKKVGEIAVTLRSIFLKIFTYFVYDSVYNFFRKRRFKILLNHLN